MDANCNIKKVKLTLVGKNGKMKRAIAHCDPRFKDAFAKGALRSAELLIHQRTGLYQLIDIFRAGAKSD